VAYPHWQYFLTLDGDLQRLSRYIEIDAANYGVYSVELVRILLAAASEVDVVAKLLCAKLGTQPTKPKGNWNMDDSRLVILAGHPNLSTLDVTVPSHGLILSPWHDWQNSKNPSWWQRYNAVKHQRDTAYKDANLENALNAVAGLYVLTLYLYGRNVDEEMWNPSSRLFWMDSSNYNRPGYLWMQMKPLP
jgi:hypothetical protein